jgi:sirohydrochlorin ferrochelatase
MEVSDVRRRIRAAIEAARLAAAERRTRRDEASRAYEEFLEATAVPAFHTVVNALVGEGYRFKVITPGRTLRMSPERSTADFIELSLDTERAAPAVVIVSSRGRGRRMVSNERILGEDPAIGKLTEEDVVAALLEELLPFIER